VESNKEIFIRKLLDIGYIKYEYLNEMQHIPPFKNASPAEGLEYIDKVINEVVDNLKYLDEYVNYLEKLQCK